MKNKTEYVPEPRIYRIIRFRQNGAKRLVRKNCTLTEVQNYCRDPKTKGPGWFCGWDYMRGCAPAQYVIGARAGGAL
jgi:hypothetical protein